MFEKIKKTGKRMLALLLAVSTTLGAASTTVMQLQAADGTITFNSGEDIYYGD